MNLLNLTKTQKLVLEYLIAEFSKESGHSINSEKIYNDLLKQKPKLKISEQETKETLRFLIHNTDFFIDCSSFGEVAVLPKNNGALSNYNNLLKEEKGKQKIETVKFVGEIIIALITLATLIINIYEVFFVAK